MYEKQNYCFWKYIIRANIWQSPLIRETIYGSSISYLKSAVNISVNIGQLAKNFSAIGPTPDAPAATPQLIPSIASITSASVGALNYHINN